VTAVNAIQGITLRPFGTLLASGGVVMDIDRTLFVQMAVFVMLILVLSPMLFKPVLRLFEERERRTEGARSAAREMQDKAEDLLHRYQAKLDEVKRAAQAERDRLRNETLRLEAEIVERARQSNTRIVEHGRQQIETELGTIRRDLDAYSQKIAKEIGASVLGREVV
jgi:F-type H+-transporting ATPase subunit b